ncbi:MAG: hypothetical protein WAO21_05480 [Verrucomicrobiia bacterium]
MVSANTKRASVIGTVVLLALVAGTVIVFRHKIANQIARAGGRRAIANHLAAPLVLPGNYIWPASNFQGSRIWKAVPSGFQVFDHVPLQIDGAMCLWGSGNAEAGAVFPEQVLGIAVNQIFETLYVYHCTFYGSPSKTPVYELVFRYEDGDSETNVIRYGVDTIDFNTRGSIKNAAPSGTNSEVAWVGGSFTPDGKRPLLFCLTAIDNPKPFLKVTSIDLFSCKNRSAGVILALTAGQSGLMK